MSSQKKNQMLKFKAFFYGLYHACVLVDYNLQSVFSVPVSSATKREDI